ncbi:MAG: class I SAM-dependent methyltransferase [Bacillota bacterium]
MPHNIEWKTIETNYHNGQLNKLLFNYRECPVCGSLKSRGVWAIEDFQFFSDSTIYPKRIDVKVHQCEKCFGLYMNPCFSSLGFQILFEEAACSYGSSPGRAKEQIDWLNDHGLLQAGLTILDIGCYEGDFLRQLPSTMNRVGIDIDSVAIERGKQKDSSKQVTLICSDFENVEIADRPDVIVMFHVLEHLPNPGRVLKKLKQISHGNTRLVIEVPIFEKAQTNDINGFFSVQHLTHFSKISLKNCLQRFGWEIVKEQMCEGYNGYRVLLKPTEENLVIEINKADKLSLYEYLISWYKAVASAEDKILQIPDNQLCVICGGGLHTEFLYQTTSLFREEHRRTYLIVDGDPNKHGKSWRGIRIYSPEILKQINLQDTILVISSYGSQEAISDIALKYGCPQGQIYKLYDYLRVY